jgi:hypothetical protein
VPARRQHAHISDRDGGPPAATLVCEGCGARVAFLHDPPADLIEGVQVFVAAHARCDSAWYGYRIDLAGGGAA